MYRQLPMVVVLPETVAQVAAIMALAAELNVKVVPRGGGTSLSGGSLPLADGILLAMGKFNRILEIDYANRCAVVQPGRRQSRHHQGGGGRRLLLRARSVLADRLFHRRQCRGEFRRHPLPEIWSHHQQYPRHRSRADGRRRDPPRRQASRYRSLRPHRRDDGLRRPARRRHRSDRPHPEEARSRARRAARLSLGAGRRRLRRRDHRAGHHSRRAGDDGSGLHPSRPRPYQPCGYPRDAGSIVIAELDGTAAEVDHLIDRVSAIAREQGATTIKVSTSEAERQQFWQGPQERLSGGGRDRAGLSLHGRDDPALRTGAGC